MVVCPDVFEHQFRGARGPLREVLGGARVAVEGDGGLRGDFLDFFDHDIVQGIDVGEVGCVF